MRDPARHLGGELGEREPDPRGECRRMHAAIVTRPSDSVRAGYRTVRHSSPMSSFHSSGLAAMKSVIICDALGVVEHDHLDAAGAQVVLAAHERGVLADDHPRDPVQQDRPGAHVARRQRRHHRRPGVHRRRQAAGVLEAVGLAVLDRAALLHAPVVADGEDLAVDDERGADRDPALGEADAGLGDRGLRDTSLSVIDSCSLSHARRYGRR